MKLVLLFLALLFFSSNAKKSNKAYKCDVCKAVVDEVEHDISQVDPKKMIQVGSYRVDPNGKTRTVQKKYARSETHISELLDGVCEKISQNYMEVKDEEIKGITRLKRLVTHDGKMSPDIDMKALMDESNKGDKPPGDKEKKIKFAVSSLGHF